MGFERIVSVLQDVDSNYKIDLLQPLLDITQGLSGHTDFERDANLTSYRVIADHARAASFLIADGVVPGNVGRNYVCRMIIRRAARFGGKIGLKEPFLAAVAEKVIELYGDFYPELARNRAAILSNLTREEERFQRTVESGVAKLENLLARLPQGERSLPGDQAFDLYATYGLPLELTRDIAREQGLSVDEAGFHQAMEKHRLASGAGEAFGALGGEDAEFYRDLLADLQAEGMLGPAGVEYNPYEWLQAEGQLLTMIGEGQTVVQAAPGDKVAVLLPATGFYVESGGQVSDAGAIRSLMDPAQGGWEIRVDEMRKPAAGVIVHIGEVLRGEPKVGDQAIAQVDIQRRHDIMRNHTATHLLHAELRAVLGEHARQAGSLVAPDRLRFDFTHPQAVTPEQLARIEAGVNRAILESHPLKITLKPLQQAMSEGAMALFGEKYAETVRTISIGDDQPFSYELCGGTHVDETGDIGVFLITSEGSAAAGIRRIEAVTGRGAYELIQRQFSILKRSAELLASRPEDLVIKITELIESADNSRAEASALRQDLVRIEFLRHMDNVQIVRGVPVLAVTLPDADADTLRLMADLFRQRYPTGVVVLSSVTADKRPLLITSLTEDLVKRGLHAGELAKFLAQPLGGSGGGRPTLAQAGGKDARHLAQALALITGWVEEHLK